MGQKRTCQRAVELVRFVPIQHRRGSNAGAFREIVGVRRSTGPGIAVHDRTLPFTLPCAAEKALNPGQRPAAYECGPKGNLCPKPLLMLD
jgi:hypothetical protein